MSNNYKTHLTFELEHLIEKERSAQKVASQSEGNWKRVSFINANSGDENSTKITETEFSAQEEFRDDHAVVSGIRTERGEVEEELFQFGEDEGNSRSHQ